MIVEHDITLAVEGCRRLSEAIGNALKHPLPDWMAHRLNTLRTEVDGVMRDFKNHKEVKDEIAI